MLDPAQGKNYAFRARKALVVPPFCLDPSYVDLRFAPGGWVMWFLVSRLCWTRSMRIGFAVVCGVRWLWFGFAAGQAFAEADDGCDEDFCNTMLPSSLPPRC
jgi:hypothetical protein